MPDEPVTVKYIYKCRQCGGIDDSSRGGSNHALVNLIASIQGQSLSPMHPKMHSVHTCGPNRAGISDLIGYEPE